MGFMKRFVVLCLIGASCLMMLSGCDNIGKNFNEETINNANHAVEENNTHESLSNSEVIDSVLSSIGYAFHSKEAYTSYNFIDAQVGYFFHFMQEGHIQKLKNYLKTTDGGKNWFYQTITTEPDIHRLEYIICAKMVTENVGLISGRYYADSDIRNRTYITSNGGLTWYAPEVNRNVLCCAEAYDMIYQNGDYILYFREKYLSSGSYEYKYYMCSSKDLQTWTLIEQ